MIIDTSSRGPPPLPAEPATTAAPDTRQQRIARRKAADDVDAQSFEKEMLDLQHKMRDWKKKGDDEEKAAALAASKTSRLDAGTGVRGQHENKAREWAERLRQVERERDEAREEREKLERERDDASERKVGQDASF